MTSVANVYKYSDPGAPQLTGQFGSLVALLDAVLVNGYGVGNTAKPGAGWTIAFSGTNKRVYKGNSETGTGVLLRVDDSATDARVARVRAYESMSGVDQGVGLAPTLAQSAGGRVWVKSNAASSASRVWEVIATDTAFYLFVSPIPVTVTGYETVALTPSFAGDIQSNRDGDTCRFMIMDNGFDAYASDYITGFTAPGGQWMDSAVMPTKAVGTLLRTYNQEGAAVPAAVARASSGSVGTPGALGGGGAAFPDPVTGGLLFERALVVEARGRVRGCLPGVFVPLHDQPFSDGQQVEDLVGVGGAVLRAKTAYAAVGSNPTTTASLPYLGQLLFDLSTPW